MSWSATLSAVLSSSILATSEPRTETRLDWLHAPEAWVTILLIVPAVCLAVWWIYRGEKGQLSPSRRVFMSVLRISLLLGVVAFLCEPTLTRERVQSENAYVLVLVDDSYSMGITDRYGDTEIRSRLEQVLGAPFGEKTNRLDLVRAVFSEERLDFINQLRRKVNVRLVAGSNGLRTLADLPRLAEGEVEAEPLDLSGLNLQGKVTRLGDSIYEAVNELRGETVAGVILFSDGRDNGGVLRPEEAASRLARREIPIRVVGVGDAEEPKDIRVFGLNISEVVLEGDLVPVDFNVVSRGFERKHLKVELRLVGLDGVSGRPIPRFITLKGNGEIQPVRMEFRPKNPGKYLARVEISYQEGELFRENNFEERPVTVLSQKIKVLYVEGPPRWEYRYLLHALVRDPTMQTHILLYSADANYLQESSPGLNPLREFPRTKDELFEYHLVIIGDVEPERLTPKQKEWLLEFVDDLGGGVIFVSGTWYLPQKYRGDPLEKLLPVVLEDTESSIYDTEDLVNEFHVRLTPEGREHPVMQLVGDPEENLELWQVQGRSHVTLPGFFWFAEVKNLKPGAVALAVHENKSHLKHGPRPIFAYQYLGRGRTFVSLVDSTWRWRRGVGNKWFYRFWGQVIRFTSAGRLLGKSKRFSVHTDQREYTLKSLMRLQARVLDERFKPVKNSETQIYIEKLNNLDGEREEITALQVPSRPEYFETSAEARELGDHRVWIEDRGEEVASTTFRVVVPQLEYGEPRMDRPRLVKIAAASGGSYHEVYEVESLLSKIEAMEKEIPISSQSESLWDSRWLLALFMAVLTLEWILRKVFRLT